MIAGIPNSSLASISWSSSTYSSISFLSESSEPFVFFPLSILFGGMIEVITSLAAFGSYFWITSDLKLFIVSPTRVKILRLIKYSSDPLRALVTHTGLNDELVSVFCLSLHHCRLFFYIHHLKNSVQMSVV